MPKAAAKEKAPAKAKAPAKEKKEKKEKDPNAPKRPLTAYFLYANDMRPKVKADNPSFKVSSSVSSTWLGLPRHVKLGSLLSCTQAEPCMTQGHHPGGALSSFHFLAMLSQPHAHCSNIAQPAHPMS